MQLRRGRLSDLDALVALERAVFTTDILSRRSFRHLLAARSADLIVAERNGRIAGYALAFYRNAARVARLYSIAVHPRVARRGIGRRLLDAIERAARRRRCRAMRLEVHEANRRALAFYATSGYRRFGMRPAYYEDGGDALRFEKALHARPR